MKAIFPRQPRLACYPFTPFIYPFWKRTFRDNLYSIFRGQIPSVTQPRAAQLWQKLTYGYNGTRTSVSQFPLCHYFPLIPDRCSMRIFRGQTKLFILSLTSTQYDFLGRLSIWLPSLYNVQSTQHHPYIQLLQNCLTPPLPVLILTCLCALHSTSFLSITGTDLGDCPSRIHLVLERCSSPRRSQPCLSPITIPPAGTGS